MCARIASHNMRWASRSSLLLAILILLGQAATPNQCLSQTTPPPQGGDPMTAWANWINDQAPQAVPQQSITLGTFQAAQNAPAKLLWQPSVPSSFCTSGQGSVVAMNPPLCLSLNSYDMQYQFAIAKPANYDMQVVLTAPLPNGGTEKIAGVFQSSSTALPRVVPPHPGVTAQVHRSTAPPAAAVATISFHPHVLGTQYIEFFHGGSLMKCDFGGHTNPCSFSIKASLQPQLGAFVVPYLPITIIYQPKGCGPCASHPNDMCGSVAEYSSGYTLGTSLSWDYSTSSGTISTKSSSDITDDYSAFLSALSMIPGPNSAALSDASAVFGAVKGIWNTTDITEQQTGQGTTQSKGWSIAFNQKFNTDVCSDEDLFVYLKNVLFVYFVVPEDPASGNASIYGVPTVRTTAVHYDPPVVPLSASQVRAQLPPDVAQQLVALDLQMNPDQLAAAVRTAQPAAPTSTPKGTPAAGARGPSIAEAGRLNQPLAGRLSFIAPVQACPTTFANAYTVLKTVSSQSGSYQTAATTTTTNVTGFLASILGKAGETTQTVRYTASKASWQQTETGSGLSLECPEYAPADAWNMNIYYDNMLGSLLAVPAGIYQPAAGSAAASAPRPEGVQGVVRNPQGRPVANQHVVLSIAGHRYETVSDKNGQFAFRSRLPILPAGTGSLIIGNQRVPVRYNHTLTTVNLRISGSPGGVDRVLQ